MVRRKIYRTCISCGLSDHPFMAKGLCNRCYLARYRAEHKDAIASGKRRWREAHAAHVRSKSKLDREYRYFDGKRDRALLENPVCVRCGSADKLVVHHKDRNGRPAAQPNNAMANLEVVCRACHIREHHAELMAARRRNRKPKLKKSGRWSRDFDFCTLCLTAQSTYAAKGLCSCCYQRVNPKKVKSKKT